MREILFRGKKLDNGQWVCGSLISVMGKAYIEEQVRLSKSYEVDSDTVGQYIGLKDKNGTKIFEGDICVHNNEYHYPRPLTVEWIEDYMCFSFVDVNDYHKNYFFQKRNMDNIKVIGNIHDNKDLLK